MGKTKEASQGRGRRSGESSFEANEPREEDLHFINRMPQESDRGRRGKARNENEDGAASAFAENQLHFLPRQHRDRRRGAKASSSHLLLERKFWKHVRSGRQQQAAAFEENELHFFLGQYRDWQRKTRKSPS